MERGNSAYLLVTFLVYKFDFDHFYILAAYLRVLLNIISLLIFIICRKKQLLWLYCPSTVYKINIYCAVNNRTLIAGKTLLCLQLASLD